MTKIRNATLDDAVRLLEIYDYYVKNTAVSFEYTTPALEEFQERMKNIMSHYPFLVLEHDGFVVGYAYASSFNTRQAYARCCETTIYLDHKCLKRGYGRMIYESLEKSLREIGFLNMYACVAFPETADEFLTTNSADFHLHLGFKKVGEFHKCGFKFNKWYNMLYFEKIIGNHK